MRRFLSALWCGSAIVLLAQDAVQVDPKHFKVEYQDVKTRVVREILGPGETAPMHSHPERVLVVVRGGKLRITDAAGKTEVADMKAGDVEHLDPSAHTVTNIGNTIFEEVSTEFVTPTGKQPPDAIVPTRPNERDDLPPVNEAPPKPPQQAEASTPKVATPAAQPEKPKAAIAAAQAPLQTAPPAPIKESSAAR